MRCPRVAYFLPVLPAALVSSWLVLRPSPSADLAAAPPEAPATKDLPAPGKDRFAVTVKPVFAKYCVTCHNDKKKSGELSLERLTDTASASKERDLWDKVKEYLGNREMPPKGKPQPSEAERQAVIAWIDTATARADCDGPRDPGRPTIRRLNRVEYDNTIRDLIGLNLKPADVFPSDDVGYGFDNIGDVLSLPPILLEKYLAAAEKVLDAAVVVPRPIVASKDVFRSQNVRTTLGPFAKQERRIAFTQNGAAFLGYDFAYEGEYVFRARAYGEQAGDELPKLVIQLDRNAVSKHDVEAVAGKPKLYEGRAKVSAGRHEVRFEFTNHFEEKADKDQKPKARNLYIDLMEVEGPFHPVPKPLPESHKRIFITKPTGPGDREAAARTIIEKFATRAYRRPVRPGEVERLMKLYQFAAGQEETFEAAVKHALKAVLVSPHFLFRIERDAEPENPRAVHPVSQYELATRLSYFLWSSMPDEELYGVADRGKLRDPGVIEAQVRRMLKDPKAGALVESFAGQWLMLRTFATITPDRKTYRGFDDALRAAMVRETELYFDHVMREDRSVLEFLDSDYTFLNERLAKHYGIGGVKGSEFRKLVLTDKSRGGLLTQGSVLTVTSNPTRTSPVKRGKWILENILGTPPPPPPPDVPELPDDSHAVLTGSLRQRMEKHRENPSCAVCHAKLDPLGFGLENFDAVGAFREQDGTFKIDPSGELPDGSKFSGPAELRKVLLKRADLFRKNLAEKMLTYALGRGLEYYDKCTVEDIVAALKKGDDRFSALMIAVVQTDAFQKRRGGTGRPK